MVAAATLEAVDARIAAVRAALDRTSQNLLDLDNDPIRKMLGASTLDGRTSDEWKGADDQIALLWQWYSALSDAVTKVTEARGTRSRLADDQINRLVALLSGPTVQLSTAALDLAQRTLTGPATVTTSWTIDQLIATMSGTFERIAGVVAQTSSVWDQVIPRLADLDASLTTVERNAATTGIKAPNDVAVARRLISELRDRAGRDPLSVEPDALTALVASVERARATVDAAVRAKADLDGAAAATAGELDQIQSLLERAQVARAAAAEKILGAAARLPTLDAATTELAALRAELAQLDGRGRDDWQEADRRLTQINQRSTAALAGATALLTAASADIAQRDELRGRLGAYRAKAQAVGRAEDLVLDRLYQQAQAMLYSSPCDVTEATRLVTEYQRALSRPAIEDR